MAKLLESLHRNNVCHRFSVPMLDICRRRIRPDQIVQGIKNSASRPARRWPSYTSRGFFEHLINPDLPCEVVQKKRNLLE